jgi:hypothetical protein
MNPELANSNSAIKSNQKTIEKPKQILIRRIVNNSAISHYGIPKYSPWVQIPLHK